MVSYALNAAIPTTQLLYGFTEEWFLRTVYQCSHCEHQESVTAETALEGTKAPLFSWILVMFAYVISKTGTSAKYISDLTGLSYHTTKLMLRKIKQAQKQDNETHVVTDCDAIELDVFSYGERNMDNVDGEQKAKSM